MVEVVLDVGLRLDEPEPKALLHVEICRAVLAVDRDPLEPPERLPQVVDPQRDVLESPLLPRPFLCEERQLAAARVRPDERELVGALDHVHREPLGQEVRDGVAIGHPERDMVQGLGPHPARNLPSRMRPTQTYFFRLTAARSCRLFIRERPLTFRRLASL